MKFKMLVREKFRENEKVQIVDETFNLFIWASATILSFINDWAVKVIWNDYPKYPATIVEVPQDLRMKEPECWNIRKFQIAEAAISRNQRRVKRYPLPYNPRTCARNFQVKFSSILEWYITSFIEKIIYT